MPLLVESFVAISLGTLAVWLILGAITGLIVDRAFQKGYGWISAIIGILAAFLASFLIGLFIATSFGFFGTAAVAIVGAALGMVVLPRRKTGAKKMTSDYPYTAPSYNPPVMAQSVKPYVTSTSPAPLPSFQPSVVPSGVRIFVSHSHKDEAITLRLVRDLQQAGATVWVDVADIQSGDFMARINAALSATDWVVLVQTPNSLSSKAVQAEIGAALSLSWNDQIKGVIPFIVIASNPKDEPPMLRTQQHYDATSDYQGALPGLLHAVGLR